MTEPTITIRASSLPRYADCPRRAASQIFRKEIEAGGYRLRRLPHSIAASLGSATHRAAEVILREKSYTGELPGPDVGTDACLDHLSEALKQGETSFDQTTPSRGDAIRQGVSMSRLFYRSVAPLIQPLLIEHRLEANAGEGIILSGQADCIAVEPGQIDDLKTGARNPGNFNAQIGAYSLLARSAGIPIEQGAIDFIKRVPVSKPQPDPIRITVPLALAEATAVNVLRHIADDLRVFRNGDDRLGLKAGDPAAFMANPNSNLCSAKYCTAHSTTFCHEWRKSE
jgi:hypothetical protein